jgi:hypothetical protein
LFSWILRDEALHIDPTEIMSDKILLDKKRGKKGDCVHEVVKMKDSSIDPTRIMSDRILGLSLTTKRGDFQNVSKLNLL